MSRVKLLILGAVVSGWLASCIFCLMLGYSQGKGDVWRRAVRQYQLREHVDEKAGFLFGVDLCVANGGLRRQCVDDVRRLEEITKGK